MEWRLADAKAHLPKVRSWSSAATMRLLSWLSATTKS